MRLARTHTGPEAQRFAEEPPPYGAGWPDVADIAETILVHASEPHEPGPHFHLLLAYDGEGNEVGQKTLVTSEDDTAEAPSSESRSERRWICLP
jgi:hypothetical protein